MQNLPFGPVLMISVILCNPTILPVQIKNIGHLVSSVPLEAHSISSIHDTMWRVLINYKSRFWMTSFVILIWKLSLIQLSSCTQLLMQCMSKAISKVKDHQYNFFAASVTCLSLMTSSLLCIVVRRMSLTLVFNFIYLSYVSILFVTTNEGWHLLEAASTFET